MIKELKAALVTAISTQAFAALCAIPGVGWFFALPVIRNAAQWIIEKAVGWAVQETSVGLSLLWIQLEMSHEIATAEEARRRLAEMLNEPSRYTVEQQQEIEEYFDETTVDLIQLAIKRLA